MISKIDTKTNSPSFYQPSEAIASFTDNVRVDLAKGDEILQKTWTELNGMSVLERADYDQRRFNQLVDSDTEDPDEAWKWHGTRGIARTKALGMHANLTASYIIPSVTALNDNDEEDAGIAGVMRDCMEYLVENSEYKPVFLLATQGMLVNPVTYIEADWCEAYQTIKEKTESGYTKTEILDDVFSGFQPRVLSCSQVKITNAHEQNIQKQRTVIKERWVEYQELKSKWGEHPNFSFVQHGVNTCLDTETGLFYDIIDDDHPTMCKELTYYDRQHDCEVTFLGGIYMGDEDVELNPFKHRNNRNAPRVPIVPFGYERINEHFFFYKSLINRIGWDDMLIDAMYEMGMNREFLDLMPPIVASGDDKLDSSIMFPGGVFASPNKDVDVRPILPPSRGNLFASLSTIEQSISDATLSETQLGQLPEASQKAFTVAKADQSSRIMLMGAMKNMGISMVQLGDLMIDIVLQYLTIAELDEIAGGSSKLKYKNILLTDQMVNGKKATKYIRFDDTLLGKEMSEKDIESEELKMLKESKYPKGKTHIYRVNPFLFSKMRYMVKINPEEMIQRNEAYRQSLNMQMYQILRQDPLIEPEMLVRNLLDSFYKGKSDDFMAQNAGIMGNIAMPLPSTKTNVSAPTGAISTTVKNMV